MKRLTIYLAPALDQAFRAQARRADRSLSTEAARAIRRYLEEGGWSAPIR